MILNNQPTSDQHPMSSHRRSRDQSPQTTSSFLTYPGRYLYRRLLSPSPTQHVSGSTNTNPTTNLTTNGMSSDPNSSIFTPPHRRTASPFQPPPLSSLSLHNGGGSGAAQILTRALAEEIRLLLPPRLALVTDWTLAYAVERDGASISTLYERCGEYAGGRHGFVLVVRDGVNGVR